MNGADDEETRDDGAPEPILAESPEICADSRASLSFPGISARMHGKEGEARMKVTVNIDCTPLEARQFFGLPDVQPMQAAVMDALEKRMMKEMETYTPEKLFEAWMPLMSANRDLFSNFFKVFSQGVAQADGKKDK
jgi:hypothetical protein